MAVSQSNKFITGVLTKGRTRYAQTLADYGAPQRGVEAVALTGEPPETGTGKYSTLNAAERAALAKSQGKEK